MLYDLCLKEFFMTSTLLPKAEKSLSDHRQTQSIYYLHSLVQNFKICKDAPLIPLTSKRASDTVLQQLENAFKEDILSASV